jgi:hypothetical protein
MLILEGTVLESAGPNPVGSPFGKAWSLEPSRYAGQPPMWMGDVNGLLLALSGLEMHRASEVLQIADQVLAAGKGVSNALMGMTVKVSVVPNVKVQKTTGQIKLDPKTGKPYNNLYWSANGAGHFDQMRAIVSGGHAPPPMTYAPPQAPQAPAYAPPPPMQYAPPQAQGAPVPPGYTRIHPEWIAPIGGGQAVRG